MEIIDIKAEDYFQYAFFSAFTTIPKFKEAGAFYEDEISKIFSGHSDALIAIREKNKQFDKNGEEDPILYSPVPYTLFGDFDMAVFSLIDDFSFATKKFKPSADSAGFKYQINTGIIPLVQVYEKQASLFDQFKNQKIPEFFKRDRLYPFTGIATIKLNNAMLVGTGQDFLTLVNFFLICYIDSRIKELEARGVSMFYIINENLGWNELSIYFFGNTTWAMQEILFSLRQYTLAGIQEYLAKELDPLLAFDRQKISDFILPKIDSIGSDALLSRFIGKSGKNFLESHVVIATSITYGYHALLSDYVSDPDKLKGECKFTPQEFIAFEEQWKERVIKVAWNVKPGHEIAANSVIQKVLPRDDQKLYDKTSSGKYPFTYPAEAISFEEYINFGIKADREIREEIYKHIIKFRSRLQWISKKDYKDFDHSSHYNYSLDKLKFESEEIKKIQDRLRIYPIPYIFKSQIENLIINFNDAVSDSLMYNYFMGLKPAIENFLKEHFWIEGDTGPGAEPEGEGAEPPKPEEKLKKGGVEVGAIVKETTALPAPISVRSVNIDNITDFIQAWNKAYWNRYFHSYYFSEINDFNIEHHGGIQQILLTYDVLYKLISKRIYGKFCKRPFVNVQIGPVITSAQFYTTVNFNHLFRPAVYACECVHEAANHVIPYLFKDRNRKEFKFLINARKEGVDMEQLTELTKLEERIQDRLGPVDDFEKTYMTEHFGLNVNRHLTADYITFKLAYEDPDLSNDENVKSFYHTHWYIFLMRADLYSREMNGVGSWFLKEEEFKVLFIRFNLMIHIFLGFDESKLLSINDQCPSVELKPLWESEKRNLVSFVVRLAETLSYELNKVITADDTTVTGLEQLKAMMDKLIIEEGLSKLSSKEVEWYGYLIKHNRKIIRDFTNLFARDAGVQYNIVKRLAKNQQLFPEKGPGHTNIDFYKESSGHSIFLDPKGNLFSTSAIIRKKVYEGNIEYIKSMWNLSMKILLQDYETPGPAKA